MFFKPFRCFVNFLFKFFVLLLILFCLLIKYWKRYIKICYNNNKKNHLRTWWLYRCPGPLLLHKSASFNNASCDWFSPKLENHWFNLLGSLTSLRRNVSLVWVLEEPKEKSIQHRNSGKSLETIIAQPTWRKHSPQHPPAGRTWGVWHGVSSLLGSGIGILCALSSWGDKN